MPVSLFFVLSKTNTSDCGLVFVLALQNSNVCAFSNPAAAGIAAAGDPDYRL
jgi:hypothetical protein